MVKGFYIWPMPVYFDHNATTRPSFRVLQAVSSAMAADFGNPSSQHWAGQDAKRVMDKARSQVASLLGARVDEIVFTSGATESNNMVIRGVVAQSLQQGRALRELHIVTSAIEHKSVLSPLADLESQGLQVTYVPAGWDGRVNARQVEASLEPNTVLVSVMLANNDTGVIQPVDEIVRFAHARGVLVHCDAVQAVGKIPVAVKELGVDFLSLSAHKFYGPKGVGGCFVRNGKQLPSLLLGGKQELSMRAGTENVPGIAGLGEACAEAQTNLAHYAVHCGTLRDRLQAGILRVVPDARIYGELAARAANTLNVGLPGVDGMSLMLNLDLEGFAISVGSACGAGDHEPSHVLRGMGCTDLEALSTVRFSLGLQNTEAEVDACVEALARLVPRLRRVHG